MSSPKQTWFLPYQTRWIQDASRIKIMEKSRQIGITFATAYQCVRQHANPQNALDSWVSSRDESQAQLFIQDCQKLIKTLQKASKNPIAKDVKPSSNTITFPNGSKIVSLSSNPDAQAGKRGSRILDEFALHPDPKQLYSIAYPGITWGGQLQIVSTHRGSQNFFNQLIQDISLNGNPKNISLHRVTLEDALNQGLLQKLQRKLPKDDPRAHMTNADYFDFVKSSCPDTESFLQEYMCQPMDESSLFLTMDLIDACLYTPSDAWDINLHHPSALTNLKESFLGVDIGRNHDLTVFWLLESIHNVLFTKKIVALKNTPFHEQNQILQDFLKIPSLKRVCIDQTGIGRQFTEEAQRQFGKYRIEGVTFTNSIKESLAYNVRSKFEQKTIKIPNSTTILSDLRSIKRAFTPSGNIRFDADRNQNGHSDHFWALALAIHASQNTPKTQKSHFELLPPSSPRQTPIL